MLSDHLAVTFQYLPHNISTATPTAMAPFLLPLTPVWSCAHCEKMPSNFSWNPPIVKRSEQRGSVGSRYNLTNISL